jgi:tRNA U34 5-carboxymethylaminomethyl modifying GTPase MnmE/TrmE
MTTQPEMVTQVSLAKELGVTKQAISLLVLSGRLPSVEGTKKLDREVCIKLYRENIAPAAQHGGAGNTTYDKARTRKTHAEAIIKEIDAQRAMGEVMAIDDVQKQAFNMYRSTRDALLNIPSKISPELACETDPHKVEQMLNDELRGVLEQLANQTDKNVS